MISAKIVADSKNDMGDRITTLEIHIQDLAFKMLEAYNESIPKLLKEGEWHIPFAE